jgi:hypothetical protein
VIKIHCIQSFVHWSLVGFVSCLNKKYGDRWCNPCVNCTLLMRVESFSLDYFDSTYGTMDNFCDNKHNLYEIYEI